MSSDYREFICTTCGGSWTVETPTAADDAIIVYSYTVADRKFEQLATFEDPEKMLRLIQYVRRLLRNST
jgi:hypothetical protein